MHICPQKSGAYSLRGKGSLEWCDVVDFRDPEPFDIVLDNVLIVADDDVKHCGGGRATR